MQTTCACMVSTAEARKGWRCSGFGNVPGSNVGEGKERWMYMGQICTCSTYLDQDDIIPCIDLSSSTLTQRGCGCEAPEQCEDLSPAGPGSMGQHANRSETVKPSSRQAVNPPTPTIPYLSHPDQERDKGGRRASPYHDVSQVPPMSSSSVHVNP